ncbi:UPF0182 family membrane protein [Luteococcus sp. Sow4_B9]|uniref:UPF0182 family membrane protein n=1 Tax=Luteococcus sp. Sow4_B9 TaxID=3438792 RepID=UPI003F9B0DAD
MSTAHPAGGPARRPGRPRPAQSGTEQTRLPRVLAVAGLLLVAIGLYARIWTDWLWFKQLGFTNVFRTRLGTGLLLFLVFGGLTAAVVALNLWLAHRMRPRTRGPETPFTGVTRSLLESRHRLAIALAALSFGLLSGLTAFTQRDLFLAWRHATAFGTTEPWFDRDVSFYVFDYPWWRFVLSQAFWMVGVSLFLVLVAHLALGALQSFTITTTPSGQNIVRRQPARLSGAAQAHMSVLAGVMLVLYAVDCWLDRYGFAVTDNWLFTGIGYADLRSRVVAKNIVAMIALLCALLFFLNARLRRWNIPLLAVVLMLASSVLISGAYPAVVQRFDVQPKGPARERDYISENITATRAAFGINSVEITEDYDATTSVSAGQLKQDAEALPGIRLIDPSLIGPTFEQLQQVRGYYSFPKVLDVDRYTIDGQFTDAVVAAREINHDKIPDKNWTNLHTVYTHGYGVVGAYGNRRQANGEPEWIARDIPTKGKLGETQSRIYFGERTNTYAVVGAPQGADPVELDTPGGGKQGAVETRNTYDGKGGVGIGNPLIRALYAIRFGDVNLLLSTGRVNEASRILYDRTPRERLQKVAPWLTPDSDAYPAVVDGRIVWIVDAYTTSGLYPNSNQVEFRQATSDSQTSVAQQSRPVNYLRNSVKAVVDAGDGEVTLYAWDEADPILKTWQKVYPGKVKPRTAIPEDLLDHMRYPSDLFKVQREVLSRYHTTNPDTWFQQSDLWEVPNDPVAEGKEAPNYLSIKWPGDKEPVFSQTSVLVPRGRENLGAYMAVNADASSPDYGQMRVLKLSDSKQVAGPGQTFNAMNTDETVASKLRPYLMQGSAQAHFGNLLTIPVGGGLLYVSPVYTQQSTTSGGYLVLRFVVVRFGEHIGIGATLQEALDSVFKGDAGASTGEETAGETPQPGAPGTPAEPVTGQEAAQKLLNEAATAFEAADAALKKGDLAGYQKQMDLAKQKVKAADAALR